MIVLWFWCDYAMTLPQSNRIFNLFLFYLVFSLFNKLNSWRLEVLEPQFLTCGVQPFWKSKDPFSRVTQPSCISDIYITTATKIILWLGVPKHEELYYRIAALGSLRNSFREMTEYFRETMGILESMYNLEGIETLKKTLNILKKFNF